MGWGFQMGYSHAVCSTLVEKLLDLSLQAHAFSITKKRSPIGERFSERTSQILLNNFDGQVHRVEVNTLIVGQHPDGVCLACFIWCS